MFEDKQLLDTEERRLYQWLGYMKEYKVERFLRDAKLFEIGGDTTDIQKIIILTRKLMLEE